jgi:hypothetical protein
MFLYGYLMEKASNFSWFQDRMYRQYAWIVHRSAQKMGGKKVRSVQDTAQKVADVGIV